MKETWRRFALKPYDPGTGADPVRIRKGDRFTPAHGISLERLGEVSPVVRAIAELVFDQAPVAACRGCGTFLATVADVHPCAIDKCPLCPACWDGYRHAPQHTAAEVDSALGPQAKRWPAHQGSSTLPK